MPLTDLDRVLIQRCLDHDPGAWEQFVDRFVGLIYYTILQSAQMRGAMLQPQDVEDLAADVMWQIVQDDFKVLREFRGKSSLPTYLTVIARRITVHHLLRWSAAEHIEYEPAAREENPELAIENAEEVKRLLGTLHGKEAELVRGYYLEHKTYREISQDMGIPENSIGPLLSRLRERMKKAASQ